MAQPTYTEIERIAILTEEAAEVQQIAMKIMRHGFDSHNPFDEERVTNRRLLEKEIGDFMFAVQLMVEYYDLNEHAIAGYRDDKRNRIQQYLHHNTAIKTPQPSVSDVPLL